MDALRAAVERYFTSEFLFAPANSFLRERISPSDMDDINEKEEEGGSGQAAAEPPAVNCVSLLNLPGIQAALAAAAAATASESESGAAVLDEAEEDEDDPKERDRRQALLIAESIGTDKSDLVCIATVAPTTSTAVSAVAADVSVPPPPMYVRRRRLLDPRDDPALRTVVARPLPAGATLDEVAEFFSALGGGGRVENITALRQTTSVTESGGGALVSSSSSSAVKKLNPFWCAFAVCFVSQADAAAAVSHFDVPAGEGVAAGPAGHKRKRRQRRRGGDARVDSDDDDDDVDDDDDDGVVYGVERFPHFGSTESRLLQRFFPPRLYVSPLAEYEATQRQKRRDLADRQLKINILKAQTALIHMHHNSSNANAVSTAAAAADAPSPSSAPSTTTAEVSRYLRMGVTLAVDAVPPTVTWAHIKSALGGLDEESTTMTTTVKSNNSNNKSDHSNRRWVQLVQVVDCPNGGRKAFVVCTSPEAASELLLMFAACEEGTRATVTKIAPGLRAVTAEEEAFAKQQFPLWAAPRVKRKMGINKKGGRRVY